MIQKGSKVSIHYTLTVDEQVVDTSSGGEPLQYTQGSSEIIPGLESALEGLAAGAKKSVTLAPEEGYGAHNPQAVQKVPRSAFKEADKITVGDVVSGQAEGRTFQARVIEMTPEEITLDFNHPLAGKTLSFAVEIVSIS